MKEIMTALLAHPQVAAALAALEADREKTLRQQLELVAVPAPSNDEARRSAYFAGLLRAEGYAVKTDAVNNVFATVHGSAGQPTVVLAAHLDTVFPPGTDLTVRRDGQRYIAPGINDDTRGLAEILSIARAIKASGLRLRGNLILCANVGEEGLGNLRGVRQIFAAPNDIDAFVSIDGIKPGNIAFCATGSHRYRVVYQNSGGHSFGAFGMANPIHAMGRAIGEIAKLKTPAEPKTTFSVGVVSGGTSVNSIAYEASMLIDMRSNSQTELERFDAQVMAILHRTLEEENAHWDNNTPVRMTIELIGKRPAGAQRADAPIVRAFAAAAEAVGIAPHLGGYSSTDCNIPIALGIPAAAVGRGGLAGKGHSIEEWFIPEDEHKGPQKDLLGVLALVGVEGGPTPAGLHPENALYSQTH